ncbi:MAG: tetratricopeptide repeat protein, partial [Bacteroidota bacterium]
MKKITPIFFFSFRHLIIRLFPAHKIYVRDSVVYVFLFTVCCLLPAAAFSQVDSVGSLKSGVVQFNQGNYEGAQVELIKAVELNPKNPDAFFYLAEVSFILNETKKA